MRRLLAALLTFILLAAPAHAQHAGWSPLFSGGAQKVLCSIRGANFNVTTDQPCSIPAAISKYLVTGIYVTNCSTSLTLAVGGFYPTTSKGGTPLVAATQVYSALTGATVLLAATLGVGATAAGLTGSNVYLALTTAQGGTVTCDVYVVGIDLT